jgi:hypothetical protein
MKIIVAEEQRRRARYSDHRPPDRDRESAVKNRHETNLDQLRALLEVWRQCGFDEAYRLVLAAEKMLHAERGFYEGFERKPSPDKPPLRVRFALWLLRRQSVYPWRRLVWKVRRAF